LLKAKSSAVTEMAVHCRTT